MTGPTAGTVVELELSQTGSGSAGPSDAKPKVTVGTTKVVKVWGEKASDAIDGKEIAARRKGKKGVCATLDLTVIEGLVLHYGGSFEVRLALNPDNTFHPRGTAFTHDPNKYSPVTQNADGSVTSFPEGRSLALPGEADFDRVIRFSNPVRNRVACRKFVPVTVAKITVVKPKSAEALFTADDVLKQGVNLGKNCWFNEAGATGTKEPIDCGGNMQAKGTVGDKTVATERHLEFQVGKATFSGKTEKRYYGSSAPASPAFLANELKPALGGLTLRQYNAKKIRDLNAAFLALTAAEKVGQKGSNIQKRLKILARAGGFANYVGRYPTDYLNNVADGVIKKAATTTTINPGKSLAMTLFKKHNQYVVKMNVFAFDFDCFDGKVNGTLATKP